jgi:hypothetical protein
MAKVGVKTADSTGGSTSRLSVPGWYHMSVVLADVNDDKGMPINGWRAQFAVLEGPEASKSFEMRFFHPRPQDKEGAQKWDSRKQTAFLIACGFMTESQLTSDVEFDTDEAVGRQVVMHLEPDDQPENKDKGFLQLAWADILHVDDPRVADLVKADKVKMSAGALKLLPDARRRKSESFDLEKLTGRKGAGSNGSNGNGSSSGSKQPVGAGAGVDISDL